MISRLKKMKFWDNPMITLGFIFVLIVLTVAVIAPLLVTHDPFQNNLTLLLEPPCQEHLMGTDQYGRDIYSRVIWGTRESMKIGLLSILIGASLGIFIGLISGYLGGVTDDLLVRAVNLLLSFPVIIVAIIIVGIVGSGSTGVIAALGIGITPIFARVVRGQVLSIKQNIYVEAAKALGAGNFRIIVYHILLNISGPIIVLVTLYLPLAILAESSLSFLGIGVSPDTPTWGRIIADGRAYIQSAPWICLFPGLALTVTSIFFNVLGDSLRDEFDPKLKVR
jgi:peptide/nickel transport system permease protein